ncbi:MAG: hypothetical protein Q8R08_02090 [bacterium]|nr:hypothetical protein [bacterium]
MTKLLALQYWNLLRPAPEESIPSPQIKFHPREPGAGEHIKVLAAFLAPIPILRGFNLPGVAPGTAEVFTKDYLP